MGNNNKILLWRKSKILRLSLFPQDEKLLFVIEKFVQTVISFTNSVYLRSTRGAAQHQKDWFRATSILSEMCV